MSRGLRASVCCVLAVLGCLATAQLARARGWTSQSVMPILDAGYPGPWGPNFHAVSCTSGLCFALGQHTSDGALVIERSTGAGWSPEPVVGVPAPLIPEVVSCATSNACIAVAEQECCNAAPIALHWDGSRWSLSQPLNPGNPNDLSAALLTDVSCTSRRFCMAVGTVSYGGSYYRGFPDLPFAELWNGRGWRFTGARDGPHRHQGYDLDTVSCWSRKGCVAVGEAVGADSPAWLVERWNGRRWIESNLVRLPALAGTFVRGLSCPAVNRCFAVGGRVVARLTGGRWTEQTLAPQHQLDAVSCASVTGCTAVGSVGPRTLAEHWNGRGWATQTTPRPPTTGLHGRVLRALVSVSCRLRKGCTAVGAAATPNLSDNALPLIEHRS